MSDAGALFAVVLPKVGVSPPISLGEEHPLGEGYPLSDPDGVQARGGADVTSAP